MNKEKQIAEILKIEEDKVNDLALNYLLYLITMTSSEAHNQWLVRRFM